jgi:hypothetical protein
MQAIYAFTCDCWFIQDFTIEPIDIWALHCEVRTASQCFAVDIVELD